MVSLGIQNAAECAPSVIGPFSRKKSKQEKLTRIQTASLRQNPTHPWTQVQSKRSRRVRDFDVIQNSLLFVSQKLKVLLFQLNVDEQVAVQCARSEWDCYHSSVVVADNSAKCIVIPSHINALSITNPQQEANSKKKTQLSWVTKSTVFECKSVPLGVELRMMTMMMNSVEHCILAVDDLCEFAHLHL